MGWRRTSFVVVLLLGLAMGCPPLVLDVGGEDDDTDDDDASDDDTTVAPDDDTAAGCPAIQLIPANWVFDDEPVGCEQHAEIEIHSTGTEPLEIADIAFDPSSGDLTHAFEPYAETLPAGAVVVVTVTYAPTDENPDTATLAVISNDPGNPTVEAVLIGTAHYGEAAVDEFEGDGATAGFTLTQQAVPTSVQVQQNEVPVYSGWSYESEENAVVFESGHVPDDGDRIVVGYHVPGSC